MLEDKKNNAEIGIHWLRTTLNQAAENGSKMIERRLLEQHLAYGYSSLDSKARKTAILEWGDIYKSLIEWENEGWLKLLADPRGAGDDDVCVQMLKYIGGGPWTGGIEFP